MAKVGRPAKYKTAEEIQLKIDKYFNEDLPTRTAYTSKGEPYEVPCPTITGLALYLGFESRQSLYDYIKRGEFSYTIKKAATLIEKHYEELTQSGISTAIFALKNFGWKDKTEVEQTNYNVELSDADRKKIAQDLEGEL